MKTIAIVSQKGGAGKTTIAVHLATAAAAAGHAVAIIDLDPQGTAASWGDRRQASTPEVVSGQAARLQVLIDAAKDAGADLLVHRHGAQRRPDGAQGGPARRSRPCPLPTCGVRPRGDQGHPDAHPDRPEAVVRGPERGAAAKRDRS